MFSKNWLQEVYTRTQEWAYTAPESKKAEMFSMGQIYVDNYKKYGATTWYNWCIDNWGTKWNALGTGKWIDDDTITFKTAWSAPAARHGEALKNVPGQERRNQVG